MKPLLLNKIKPQSTSDASPDAAKVILASRLKDLRKQHNISQDQVAQACRVSVQAVSKWECGQSYPDIELLPVLANLFHATIGSLLCGEGSAPFETESDAHPSAAEAVAPAADAITNVTAAGPNASGPNAAADAIAEPATAGWPDDDVLRIVQFRGRKLLGRDEYDLEQPIPLLFDDEALKQLPEDAHFHVEIWGSAQIEGDINGDLAAGGGVNCDDVGGNIEAGGTVNCDSIGGNVDAGGSVNCDNVDGNLSAGGCVNCDNIEGNVDAGGSINCDDVDGNLSAGGTVTCGNVEGNVACQGNLTCDNIGGGVSCNADIINCGDIEGDVDCQGDLTCDSIEGDANSRGDIHCDSIGGNVNCDGNVTCDSIGGNVSAGGDVTCDNVGGDVSCNGFKANNQ